MEAVVRTLIDRVPESEETSAPGWRAARLPDLPYPGLVADTSSAAPGRVYVDLTDREWAVLDAFEDPEYTISVVELRSGRRALAYVWPHDALTTTWTATSLDAAETGAYLEGCAAWRARFESTR